MKMQVIAATFYLQEVINLVTEWNNATEFLRVLNFAPLDKDYFKTIVANY